MSEHEHVHTHEHVHEDGTVHSHPHTHAHTHEGDPAGHTHEHIHEEGAAHHHSHDCCHDGHTHEHSHDGHTHEHSHDATPREELLAMLKYMVGHNASHIKETQELAEQLKNEESAAYAKICEATAEFEKGNALLDEALASLTGTK